MKSLKQSFENLKSIILSANPNPWYGLMVSALDHFENKLNQYLPQDTTPEPVMEETLPELAMEESIVVEDNTISEENVIIEEPVQTPTKNHLKNK